MTAIRVKRWLDLARQTAHMAWNHDCLGQAKAAAFSTILFFFPLLLFGVACLMATDTFTVVVQPVLRFLPRYLPEDTVTLVSEYVDSTSRKDPTHLLVLSFAFMLWTGWGLMSTFIEGVNRAYGIHEERTLLKDQWAALQLLFFVTLPLVALGLFAIAGDRAQVWMTSHTTLTSPWIFRIANRCAVLLTLMAVNSIVYFIGVHRKQSLRQVLPGATLATGVWVAGNSAFRAYVGYFGRYDLVYGSFGAAIILLGLMYLGSLAVLLGGEFNAVLARAARTRDDSA